MCVSARAPPPHFVCVCARAPSRPFPARMRSRGPPDSSPWPGPAFVLTRALTNVEAGAAGAVLASTKGPGPTLRGWVTPSHAATRAHPRCKARAWAGPERGNAAPLAMLRANIRDSCVTLILCEQDPGVALAIAATATAGDASRAPGPPWRNHHTVCGLASVAVGGPEWECALAKAAVVLAQFKPKRLCITGPELVEGEERARAFITQLISIWAGGT